MKRSEHRKTHEPPLTTDDHITDCVFSDEQFMSAEEKRTVLRAWIRFLKSNCAESQFTEALYHHLSLHCSFIAHYNRLGFYEYYFRVASPDIFRFLDQFDSAKPGRSAEMGDTLWLMPRMTGSDLNQAMREAATPYIAQLRLQFKEQQRQAEINLAAMLLARHGLVAVQAAEVNTGISVPASAREPLQTALF